jgi:2-succinyl-6-hydroxy-2,4-cyclohexadiene-1-carboxylate synthase
MTLHHTFTPAATLSSAERCVVFLHGFLGDSSEWDAIVPEFPNEARLTIDLPGHGGSRDIPAADFDAVNALLTATLREVFAREGIRQYVLVGYSLGGRIAMFHALSSEKLPQGLCALLLESANPGLPDGDTDARAARLASDEAWAARFRNEPIADVLRDWYAQPVFADLKKRARNALVKQRSGNDGAAVAAMLTATSLAKQPDFSTALQKLRARLPFYFVVGSEDEKYLRLATELELPFGIIGEAGHNTHRVGEFYFCEAINMLLFFVDRKNHDFN